MIENDEINTKSLDSLIKAFKGKLPQVRVGVLGKNQRAQTKEKGLTNAEIGAKHEYGLEGMPMRSFLRVPIADNMQKYLEKSSFFNPDTLNQVVAQANITPWMQKLGLVAISIVLDGFNTGGFGKWKQSNMALKKVKQTLVETQQLRNSITFEVK